MSLVNSCTVEKLGKTFLVERWGTSAGVVPYFIYENVLYFIFGRHKPSGDFTEFGGGVKKTDGTVIRAALREFIEETLGVFGMIHEEQVAKYLCCYDDEKLLLFIPISVSNINDIIVDFNNKIYKVPEHEINEIICMKYSELQEIVENNNSKNIFYDKTFNVLKEFNLRDLIQRRKSGTASLSFPKSLSRSGDY